jgi:hypothetical protein
MMINVEQSVEWELAEETEVLKQSLSQCHLVHQKSHVTQVAMVEKAAINRSVDSWSMV